MNLLSLVTRVYIVWVGTWGCLVPGSFHYSVPTLELHLDSLRGPIRYYLLICLALLVHTD